MKTIGSLALIILVLVSVQLIVNFSQYAGKETVEQDAFTEQNEPHPEIEVFLVTAESTWQHRSNETMWGPAMKMFELETSPIIHNEEIVNYHWDRHEIGLTSRGYQKIPTGFSATGIDFVIAVDGVRVYAGTFGTSRSSDGLSWPTILVNKLSPAPDQISPDDDRTFRVKIDRNFHGMEEFDHRENAHLERALAKSNRLVE